MATEKLGMPILPSSEMSPPEVMEDARRKAVLDRATGKWYYQVSDGDWIEIPLDESGMPYYDMVLPEKAGE